MSGDLARLVGKLVAPLRNRLGAMVSRLVLDAVDDAAKRQGLRVLVLADEVLDQVEHFQPGGLTHRALPGAEGVLLCVGGSRAHALAVGVSNREARPTGLQPGETGLYAAQAGTGGLKVLLDVDGNIVLTPTASVTITGSLLVTGDVSAGTATELTTRTLLTHKHGSALGPTSPPIP